MHPFLFFALALVLAWAGIIALFRLGGRHNDRL